MGVKTFSLAVVLCVLASTASPVAEAQQAVPSTEGSAVHDGARDVGEAPSPSMPGSVPAEDPEDGVAQTGADIVDDPAPAQAPAASTDAPPEPREFEPGEMTHAQAVAYFKDLRHWSRHRYDRPLTVGIHGGYSWVASSRDVNPYRIGFGATLGYTFPIHNTYLAFSFLRFNGDDVRNLDSTDLAPGDYSSVRTSVDLGHEFIFRRVRVRPLLTGGATVLSPPAGTRIVPTFGLGATLMVPLEMLYLGIDLRADFVTSTKDGASHSTTSLATLGLRM